jgi:lipopolysaccharide export system protein LptA
MYKPLLPSALLALCSVALTQPATPASPPAQPPGQTDAQATPPELPQTGGAVPASNERIITITYDGGTRSSPDLRYGPYVYEHPQPDGVAATVSNLEIFAQRGELRAPEGVLIAEAEGQREADFTGGVRVERGRLRATSTTLTYSEATGRGVMPERSDIVVEPAEEGEEVVTIQTDAVTFDVDTDTSVSQGNVTLTNGNQDAEARELIFEETRDLAVLSGEGAQAVARRANDDGTFLTITADEIRVLTGTDVLLATGNITILDGDITTTGDMVYYDDEASRAEVVGNPAVSVDEAFGSRITGGRIEQRTDIDSVQQLQDPTPSFDTAQFDLTSETAAAR